MVEAMARERIPVVGHLGMVSRHMNWTNIRPISKSFAEAKKIYEQMKCLENACDYDAELEFVTQNLAN